MYQEHPKIETPADDTVVWRYMDLPRLLALLHSGSLYLCRLDRLRDPWEGRLPPLARAAIRSAAAGFDAFAQRMPETFFVNCWHESSCESAALWEQYGRSRGLAIKSTVGRLKGSSRAERQFLIGRVRYLDYSSAELEGGIPNFLVPAFLKRRSFEHEHEVRILLWDLARSSDRLDWSIVKESYELPVDLRVLIDSIYLSPESPDWLLDPVRDLLRRFDLQEITIRRSELYEAGIV